MGVFGLMFHWENDCDGGLEHVKLSEIATKYKNEMKKDPVIVVDISCCIRFFVKKFEVKEPKKLAEKLLMFINNCFDLGIKLKFIGDGVKPNYKHEMWKKKEFHFLRSAPEFIRDYDKFYNCIWLNVATYVFHVTDKCEYMRALEEADEFIIHYAKTEGCFAVLSNDTDVLIADGAQYHLSIKHLDVLSMTTYNYNRDNLARSLNIGISQLPIFCSLLDSYSGFDYVKKTVSLNLGASLKSEYERVADLIRELPVNDFELDSLVLKKERQKFKERLQLYMVQKKIVRPMKGNDNWSEIIGLAEKRHVTGIAERMILQVLIKRVKHLYCIRRTVENPVCWLVQLRKKIYGILFFECPDNPIIIREYCFEKLRPKVTAVIFYRRFHCGLLNLWSEDTSPEMLYKRRRVFCQALNEKLTPEYLLTLNIPEEILFTVLTLYCLLSDRKCSSQEAKIFLLQAILVNKLTTKEIEVYRNFPNESSLDLCQWFTNTLQHIQLLNSVCGEPYCLVKMNVIHNFDGTLYEYFYEKMTNSRRSEKDLPLSQEVVDYLGELEMKLQCLVKRTQ